MSVTWLYMNTVTWLDLLVQLAMQKWIAQIDQSQCKSRDLILKQKLMANIVNVTAIIWPCLHCTFWVVLTCRNNFYLLTSLGNNFRSLTRNNFKFFTKFLSRKKNVIELSEKEMGKDADDEKQSRVLQGRLKQKIQIGFCNATKHFSLSHRVWKKLKKWSDFESRKVNFQELFFCQIMNRT